MRKEDLVEANSKGPHVLRLAMSQCTWLRRQLRRILGQLSVACLLAWTSRVVFEHRLEQRRLMEFELESRV